MSDTGHCSLPLPIIRRAGSSVHLKEQRSTRAFPQAWGLRRPILRLHVKVIRPHVSAPRAAPASERSVIKLQAMRGRRVVVSSQQQQLYAFGRAKSSNMSGTGHSHCLCRQNDAPFTAIGPGAPRWAFDERGKQGSTPRTLGDALATQRDTFHRDGTRSCRRQTGHKPQSPAGRSLIFRTIAASAGITLSTPRLPRLRLRACPAAG